MKDVVRCDKPGELRTSFDPGISEWGNPPSVTGEQWAVAGFILVAGYCLLVAMRRYLILNS